MTGDDHAPDSMLDWLCRADGALNIDAPTTLEYNVWARTMLDAEGCRLAPSALTIAKHFGGWGRALHSAGLIDAQRGG